MPYKQLFDNYANFDMFMMIAQALSSIHILLNELLWYFHAAIIPVAVVRIVTVKVELVSPNNPHLDIPGLGPDNEKVGQF